MEVSEVVAAGKSQQGNQARQVSRMRTDPFSYLLRGYLLPSPPFSEFMAMENGN